MATKGYLFTMAIDRSRLKLITDHIWSLNFKKDKPVHIVYDQTASEISAKSTSSRYLITVRPDTELEEIDQLLLQKGYVEKVD